jgi:hypothetical protein
VSNSIALLEGIKEDMRAMEVEEITTTASRIEMVSLAMRKQHESLSSSLTEASAKLRKYCEECSGIDNVCEDRKAKMLEFDFFRNKVADLKRSPPADPARIPRNEAREQDWQRQYDEANDRLKNLAHKLTLQGIRSVNEGTVQATTGLTKYYGESSQTWRATFGNAGVPAAIYTGAQAAAAMATAQLPKVQQAASSAAVNAARQGGGAPAAGQAAAVAAANTATAAAVGTAGAVGAHAAQQAVNQYQQHQQQASQPHLQQQAQPAAQPGAAGGGSPPPAASPGSPAAAPSWGARVKPAGDDPFAM